MLPDQVSEVHLRVLSVEIDLGLAEDADDPIIGVVWPASVHHLASVSLVVISNLYLKPEYPLLQN